MRDSGADQENLGTEGGGRLATFQSDLDLEFYKCVAPPARRASSARGHPTLGIISFALTFATVAVAPGAPVSAQGRLQS